MKTKEIVYSSENINSLKNTIKITVAFIVYLIALTVAYLVGWFKFSPEIDLKNDLLKIVVAVILIVALIGCIIYCLSLATKVKDIEKINTIRKHKKLAFKVRDNNIEKGYTIFYNIIIYLLTIVQVAVLVWWALVFFYNGEIVFDDIIFFIPSICFCLGIIELSCINLKNARYRYTKREM